MKVIIVLVGVLVAVLGQEPEADKCMTRLEAVLGQEPEADKCMTRLEAVEERLRVLEAEKLNHGIFTAPVTRTYVFFWLKTNKDHSYMDTELVKNNVVYGKSMFDAMDHADYTAASNMPVLSIAKVLACKR